VGGFPGYHATSCALTRGVLPLVSSGGSLSPAGVVEFQIFGDGGVICGPGLAGDLGFEHAGQDFHAAEDVGGAEMTRDQTRPAARSRKNGRGLL